MRELEIREHEVFSIQREAFLKASRYLGIPDPELKTNFELQEIIQSKNIEICKAISELAAAFLNYYFFAKGISSSKKYELNPKENELLIKHRSNIDESRKKFSEIIKS